MACGFTIRWMSTEWSTCAFLVCISVSLCFGGNLSFGKENMTTAVLKCEAENGLIGLENYPDINKLMKKNRFKDVWIEFNVTNVIAKWKFLDNKDVRNPREYFQRETVPLTCGTVHLGNEYFADRNCFKSGYYALCQNCSRQTCVYFHSSETTRNWFHAREICLNRGGSLAVLKAVADIPEMSDHIGTMSWTGVHSLNDKVVLQGSVPSILANISLKGVDDVPGLVKGKSCLIAENATPVTWRVVPCSQKHSFICRGNEDRSTGKGHDTTPSYLIGVVCIMQIGNLVMAGNHI